MWKDALFLFVRIAPFYSESNMRYLERKKEAYNIEQLKYAEYELIEE